jgi:hypothetical protein
MAAAIAMVRSAATETLWLISDVVAVCSSTAEAIVVE